MAKKVSQAPLTIANSSGFPLQIGISDVVAQSSRWKILVEEHPWRSDDRQIEGFIDLVVVDRRTALETMVIECKRVRQSSWVFLLPKVSPSTRSQATVFGSQLLDGKWVHYGWEDWQADPVTYQSEYCAIPGQEQGRRNLIDRSASELVCAVEGLADQERRLHPQDDPRGFSRVYIPVIVTTAQLVVTLFAPSKVSLVDGSLPEDTPSSEVPFIRYRKSLSTRLESGSGSSIADFHRSSERTVYIVNALKLGDFLEQYEFRD